MKQLIDYFLHRSFVVNLISVAVCFVGIVAALSLKRDLIPPLQFNFINVQASLPGASAEQVEKFVTVPLEAALEGAPGREEISSTSRAGSSGIFLQFRADADMDAALDDVNARISLVRPELPGDIDEITAELERVRDLVVGSVRFDGLDPTKEAHAEWLLAFIADAKRIPGMVRVESEAPKRRLTISFKPAALANYGLTIPEVREKIAQALAYVPVAQVEQRFDENFIVELSGGFESLQSLRQLPIKVSDQERLVQLQDLADVGFTLPDKTALYLIEGQEPVVVSMRKDTASDAITVSRQVEALTERYNAKLPEGVSVDFYQDISQFIERQLQVLKDNGLFGFALVFLTLAAFVGWRFALMTIAGLPISYLGTAVVLFYLGISVDLISVIAMLLVVGILVDDAIIVSERYAKNLDLGMLPKDAASAAATSLLRPVTGTMLTTLIAFAPILFIKHPVSSVLYSIPVVIISALAISWFECFFILPNHLQHFAPRAPKKRLDVMGRLERLYAKVLARLLAWRYVTLLICAAIVAYSGFIAVDMKKEMGLRVGSESLDVDIVLRESASLEATEKALASLHARLAALTDGQRDYIESSIGSVRIGGESRLGPRYATLSINLPVTHPEPSVLLAELEERIKPVISEYKGKPEFEYLELVRKIADDEDDETTLSIYVYGGDKLGFADLERQIAGAVKPLVGMRPMPVDQESLQTVWRFDADDSALGLYGLEQASLAVQLRTLLAESEVAEIRVGGESLSVLTDVARGGQDVREDDLARLQVISKSGLSVPLSYLGKWKKTETLRDIAHKEGERALEFSVNYNKDVLDRDKALAELGKALGPVRAAYPSYRFELLPESEDEAAAKEWALRLTAVCVTGILLVLALVLGNLTQTLIVGLAIPFGLAGVIFALAAHGDALTLMCIIGLVGVAGVAVNDSLVMVDHINKERSDLEKTLVPPVDSAGRRARAEALRASLVDASSSRLRPILLTTLTTLGGVFPMAYGWLGESGFTQPLAFAMAWGLTSATLLTLIVIPATVQVRDDLLAVPHWLLRKLRRA